MRWRWIIHKRCTLNSAALSPLKGGAFGSAIHARQFMWRMQIYELLAIHTPVDAATGAPGWGWPAHAQQGWPPLHHWWPKTLQWQGCWTACMCVRVCVCVCVFVCVCVAYRTYCMCVFTSATRHAGEDPTYNQGWPEPYALMVYIFTVSLAA